MWIEEVHMANNGKERAGERARDEKREGGPRYGGGAWEVADERGERRYGHARNDDAAITEADDQAMAIEKGEEDMEEAGVVEASRETIGIRRPLKPRRTKNA
ncbi:MAG: hypothetical protein SFX73_28655 [Kofleriaceae bacterium]|nr:hypothetical protein [Kofleriaceae bacterium]